jgi:hypothetical protein
MNKLQLHPLCKMFPRMAGAEFEALKDDIQTNGLRHPIITHKGMILDGGNRYQACLDMGVKPLMTEYTGENLVTYVLSANFYRRHLSPGQQAAIVASAQDWVNAQEHGGTGANQHNNEQRCNVAPLQTVASRAAQSGASVRTQKMADKVARQSPELAVKVAHGDISLASAARQLAPTPAAESEPRPQPPEDFGPSAEELAANEAAARADAEVMAQLLDSDDKLSTAVAEVKRLNAELSVVKVSRDGYMNQCSDLIRRIKWLQRKLDDAEA